MLGGAMSMSMELVEEAAVILNEELLFLNKDKFLNCCVVQE
jgi:hypothetical protein